MPVDSRSIHQKRGRSCVLFCGQFRRALYDFLGLGVSFFMIAGPTAARLEGQIKGLAYKLLPALSIDSVLSRKRRNMKGNGPLFGRPVALSSLSEVL